jgi:hypothetical protein
VLLLLHIAAYCTENQLTFILFLLFFPSFFILVFNIFPRCEDGKGKGRTIAWCDALSITIGMLDIVVAVATVVAYIYFAKQEKCDACHKKLWARVVGNRRLERELIENEKRRSRMDSTDVTSVTNPHIGDATVEMTAMDSAGRSTEEVWARHYDASSGRWYLSNTATEEVKWAESDAEEEGEEVFEEEEPASAAAAAVKTDTAYQKRRSTQIPPNWSKHRDESGRRYYVGSEGESQWTLPPQEPLNWNENPMG